MENSSGHLNTGRAYVGLCDLNSSGRVYRFPDLPDFLPSYEDDHLAILAALRDHLAGLEAAGTPVPPTTDIRALMKDPANRQAHRWFRLDDLATHLRLQQELRQLKAILRAEAKRSRRYRARGRSGRRLAVIRPKQKVRGWKRRVGALRAWAASYEGFFPEPVRNGYGHKNWYAKLPVSEGFVCGPRAQRWFQRECMRALIAIAGRLRAQRPPGETPIRVVALISPNDVFSASVDVFWGDASFFAFFRREGPYEAWSHLDVPQRSLVQEWRLDATEAEKGYVTRYWDEDWEAPCYAELWAIGDVEGL